MLNQLQPDAPAVVPRNPRARQAERVAAGAAVAVHPPMQRAERAAAAAAVVDVAEVAANGGQPPMQQMLVVLQLIRGFADGSNQDVLQFAATAPLPEEHRQALIIMLRAMIEAGL